MKKLLIGLSVALALTGCASTEYSQYSKAQVDIATAKAASDTARYQALSNIARDGDGSAKVAAVMALALGGNTQSQAAQIAAPQRSDALMWASILVPGITQAYAIGKSADVAINSSNNAMLTSTATTAGFVNIAGKIQTVVPQANVSTTTTNTTSTSTSSAVGDTMSGTGVLGTGTYSTQANPITTNTTSTTPIIVPDVIQITPVVVPDVIQVIPIVNPNEAPIL